MSLPIIAPGSGIVGESNVVYPETAKGATVVSHAAEQQPQSRSSPRAVSHAQLRRPHGCEARPGSALSCERIRVLE